MEILLSGRSKQANSFDRDSCPWPATPDDVFHMGPSVGDTER